MTELLQHHLRLINHLFEIENASAEKTESEALARTVGRMKNIFDDMGYLIHNPHGEKYEITRSDCQASVVGDSVDNLVIVEVFKPLVYLREEGDRRRLIQQGVVVVSSAG